MSALPGGGASFAGELRAPFHYRSPDPRYEVRLARPDEYERIYELVDDAFAGRRPRALYDWLYRQNPRGQARCWAVIEKSSGRWMSSSSCWPWPLAQGDGAIPGAIAGDLAARSGSQRRGLASLRYGGYLADPIRQREIAIGWANEKSHAWLTKQGDGALLLGPLWEARLAPLPGRALPRLRGRLRGASPRERGDGLRVEDAGDFDGDFDALTARCNASKGFWSPHDAVFLNWRYRRHPTHEYRVLSLREAERLVAYTVLRLERGKARLMEFCAPPWGPIAGALLETAVEASREAGCRRLSVFSTPAWPHWPAFTRAGWSPTPARRHLYVMAPPAADALHLERWQVLPSDVDTE